MTHRVRLAIALAANVIAAALSVAGSAWLWVRASESIVGPTFSPALPPIVSEVSVPFDPDATQPAPRAPQAMGPRRPAPRARRATRGARPVVRVRFTARATPFV